MKNPDTETELELGQSEASKQWLSETIGKIKTDEMTRGDWKTRIEDAVTQRYCLDYLSPEFPWPNSSDIHIPLTDLIIERTKASYLTFLNAEPMCIFVPQDAMSYEKADKVQAYFEYLLRFRTNDFQEQMITFADSCLETGLGVGKTYWDYRTVDTVDKITERTLPAILTQFIVIDRAKPEELNQLALQLAQAGQQAGHVPVPVSGKEFKQQMFDRTMSTIYSAYRLDPNVTAERKSAEAVMKVVLGRAEFAHVRKRTVMSNGPRFTAVHPMNLIWPSHCEDIESATRLAHRLWFTEAEMLQRARDNRWNEDAVQKIIESRSQSNSMADSRIVLQQANRGDADFPSDDLIEIWEVYCEWDWDDTGVTKRVVATVDPKSQAVLKLRLLPFKHGQWPFTVAQMEKNSAQRLHGVRGIPDKVAELTAYVTQLHRMKLNRLQWEISPTLLYRRSSNLDPSVIRAIPGQVIPVQRGDDLVPLVFPNATMQAQEAENSIRAYLEQYTGSWDFGLSDANSNMSNPRTAREIGAITVGRNEINSTRLLLFRCALRRIFGQMWDLVQQQDFMGPVYVMGEQANFISSRDDIIGNFDVVPNAPVGLDDPTTRDQMAVMRMQLLMQLAPLIQQDPRYDLSLGQAAIDLLRRSDYRATQRILRVRPPEEVQQIQARMAQQAQLADGERLANIAAKTGAASGGQARAAQIISQLQGGGQQQQQQQQGVPQ